MNVSNKQICEDAPTREFLANLNVWRKALGYTQEEIAQRIGASPSTIKRYESNKTRPVLVKLLKLAEVLACDLSRSLNYKYYHGQINFRHLRQRVRKKKLTQRELVQLTGYSSNVVSATLRNTGKISLQCLELIICRVKGAPMPLIIEAPKEVFRPSLLRRMRNKAGLTQRKLAACIGYAKTTIEKYESGHRTPPPKVWRRLYECLTQAITSRQLFTFKKSQVYQIYTSYRLGRSPQDLCEYEYAYEGKRGIHHVFRERTGGWTRTYTDAQLVGKVIQEV